MSVFQDLDQAVYLIGDGPLAVLSGNKNGCTALAFETKAYAKSFIEEHFAALASRGEEFESPEVKSVNDSYEFMQLCAKYGYAGIELLSEQAQKSFQFCVRLEEVSSILPTALAFSKEDKSYIKTRFKEFEDTNSRTVKEWQRYDILDKVSAKFAQKQPFRDWEKKELYEIRPTAKELGEKLFEKYQDTLPSHITLFNLPCRKHYNALDGSVPFFTDIELAFDFLNSREFTSYMMGFFEPKEESKFNEVVVDKSQLSDYFTIVKIDDIKERARELKNPFKGICINPNGHRDSTGYILKENKDSETERLMFYGVSGTWEIGANNQFNLIDKRDSWDQPDTFYWNGVNGYKFKPLDRSFSGEALSTTYSNLPEADIDDLLDSIFSEDVSDEYENCFLSEEIEPADKLEKYVLICWDPITGEGKDMPFLFDSILDVLIWVWQYECLSDFSMRVNGAQQGNGLIGIPKSRDPEFERTIHNQLQIQLKKLFKRVISNGYTPVIGDNIAALINHYIKSLHVECVGFCKDIVWQSYDDDLEDITGILEIPDDLVDSFLRDSYNQIDKDGEATGIDILGASIWRKLSNRSKFFISSSLSHLKLLGNSPQLDYSLVSIGFVKALEYELGLLFKNFSLSNDLSRLEFDENDHAEKALVAISKMQSEKLPALGSMGHLIRPNQRDKNELRKVLGDYLDGLPCGKFLTSKKFWKEGIYKITNRYRNGGAHDSAISRETALESMDYILGAGQKEGVLPKIVIWKE